MTTTDAGTDTSNVSTTDVTLDVASLDVPLLDVPPTLDTGSDGSVDAFTAVDAPSDAPTSDAPSMCEYYPLDDVLVRCGSRYAFVSRIGVVPASDACPDYYAVEGDTDRYETADAAITGESCDGSCRWRAAMSVSRIYCGMRSGYIRFTTDTAGCSPNLYQFPDGYYESVEAHDAANPCP